MLPAQAAAALSLAAAVTAEVPVGPVRSGIAPTVRAEVGAAPDMAVVAVLAQLVTAAFMEAAVAPARGRRPASRRAALARMGSLLSPTLPQARPQLLRMHLTRSSFRRAKQPRQ